VLQSEPACNMRPELFFDANSTCERQQWHAGASHSPPGRLSRRGAGPGGIVSVKVFRLYMYSYSNVYLVVSKAFKLLLLQLSTQRRNLGIS
jgi:hypothetical protein